MCDVRLGGIAKGVRFTILEPERLWAALSDYDSAKAFEAMGVLSMAGQSGVALINSRLRPVTLPDPKVLLSLISQLDDQEFTLREDASRKLEMLGELAEPSLRRVKKSAVSVETSRRVDQLLLKLEGPVRSKEDLTAIRVTAVLEHIGSREAKLLLETIAKGAPESRATKEAKASLARLRRWDPPGPK
jgi:hypothetical protein